MAGPKYTLNIAQAKEVSLSNDAFWYLYQDEEMLDDINMLEAKRLLEAYPYGFVIDDNYRVDEKAQDRIICKLIPYIKVNMDEIKWDGENITLDKKGQRVHILKFKVINHNKCQVEWVDERQNKLFYNGECNVVYFENNPWCEIISKERKQKSYIPLSGKQVKYYTAARF